MTDVSNTIFVDAGTSIEQGIIGNQNAPFKTIDAAVVASLALPPQEWTIKIVPGAYELMRSTYVGFIFDGEVDEDIPIVNIRRPMFWVNITCTNLKIVIDRLRPDSDIDFPATINIAVGTIVNNKGVDIQEDCYIEILQTVPSQRPNYVVTPFANMPGSLFKCSASSAANINEYNFTFLVNGFPSPISPINSRALSLIVPPAVMNIREGVIWKTNYSNGSVTLVGNKETKYQCYINSRGKVTLFEISVIELGLARFAAVALTNGAIIVKIEDNIQPVKGFVINQINEISLVEHEHELIKEIRSRLIDEEGPINANLRQDIEAAIETINDTSKQYQNIQLGNIEVNSVVVLIESSIINNMDFRLVAENGNLLIEINPLPSMTLVQNIPKFNPILATETIICGFILPNTERIVNEIESEQSLPILINNTQEGGSTLVSGSDLNAVTVIKCNYTHTYFDGKYFLIDASKGNIIIKIPSIKEGEQSWQGRILKYKRIDSTFNKVKIINQRGRIDNISHKISLNNKIRKNKCKCDKKKYRCPISLAKKTLIVRFDGSAYTF